ncbi:MAG: efflux RND transporter permease subunit, partial [Patescibacteria group bacterium]|nr:efflux RND transporter permease subunit [Patescibacteria group bacterium]
FPLIIFLLKPSVPNRVIIFLKIIFLILIAYFLFLILPKNNTLFLFEFLAAAIFLFVLYQVKGYLGNSLLRFLNIDKVNKNLSEKIKKYFNNGIISFHVISSYYKKVIYAILISSSARKKTILMVVIFSIFSFIIFPLGFVKNEFFPKTDQDFLYVSLELPSGTGLNKTNQEVLTILEDLRNTPEVDSVSADMGQSYSAMGVSSGGDNTALFSLKLMDKEIREAASYDIAEALRSKFSGYTKGKISVQEISSGPPAGADLQIKLFGSDLTVLDQYANNIQDFLAKQQGVVNIDKTIKPGTSKLVFVPDKNILADTGVSQDQVGFWLRFFASGFTADKITLAEDNQSKDINIRLSNESQSVEDIGSLNIPTSHGNFPISYLGSLKMEANPTLITRENGDRTISVTGGVVKGFSVTELNQKLESYANTLNLPEGYSWGTGGMNEENQESVNSVLRAMILSFLLIVITMVVQFNSFRKALIVMLVIPLSISGVFIIFAITQTPLTFPALIGILALFGIVVKNSILIVDKIIANQKTGMDFVESIADASSSRLEPIALTSLTAIFGLVPITLSDPLWQGLGGAIISGLTFSGTIMLFFVPIVYYYIFNKEYKVNRKNYKG